MGTDKNGQDVSSAMGVSSQLGNVLGPFVRVCVCGGIGAKMGGGAMRAQPHF